MDKKTLYGKTKAEKIKVWSIWTEDNSLFIEHGSLGGKQQLKQEKISGKNIGRSNETSAAEQAELEAMSRWRKQFDKGYREEVCQLDDLEISVMLAQDYLKQGHRIKYPCYGSKKLDGVRCLAICHADGVELKSRGGKKYNVPHIQDQLFSIMSEGDIFDGEIYLHLKYLEEITSAVKKANADTPNLNFVIFDIVDDGIFDERLNLLNMWKHRLEQMESVSNIQVLGYFDIADENAMKEFHQEFVAQSYEGIMLRNKTGLYESGKRSADLQKYKTFFDEEFEIIAINADRNGNAVFSLMDHVSGLTFECCYGDFEQRKFQLANPENFIGKMLTVKYQTRYKDSRLPQFPCGITIRDYE